MLNTNKNVILSFTSHKARIPLIDEIFRSHIHLSEALGLSVCFACQDDAIPYMTPYQKSLVDTGKIELLHTVRDSGSNTKWTLCREAHRDSILIVVDDDWTYDIEGIRSLLETHERFPNAIVCRAYREIPWVGKGLPHYEVKPRYSFPKTVTPHIGVNRIKDTVSCDERCLPHGTSYPEHFLGVLYPPGFPSCNSSDIPTECLKDDDVFIGGRVAAEGRDLVFAGRNRIALDREHNLPGALWASSRAQNGQGTYRALKSIRDNFAAQNRIERLGDVFLLTCKKYPLRRESIHKELERLGIEFTEIFDDGTYCPDIEYVHKRLNRCHIAKYRALETFLKSPKERVTIIEDDVRFLKNVSILSSAIKSIPIDFGACRLSWAPSPYVRDELIRKSPNVVKEIEYAMAMPGEFWTLCPWASTDGCTIMNLEVAKGLFSELEKVIISSAKDAIIDNSDDMLCRVCNRLGMPMYVYKPLLCIQVSQTNVEQGKSKVTKFMSDSFFHVPGIVRDMTEFADVRCYNGSRGIGASSEDGFGYNPSPIVRFPHPPLNPVISTRSSPMILPRIDTSRRGYSNW